MVNQRSAVEGVYVLVGLGSFLAYHTWLIFFRGKGLALRRQAHDVFDAGKLARALFIEAVLSDPKDNILAVQTIRNGLMACSFMSAISAILLTTCINVALDQSKIDRISKLADNDWSLRNLDGTALTRPSVIIIIDALSLFASFMGCAQSVRLYVHVGFYMKAMFSKINKDYQIISPEEPVNMIVRAGMAFTFGLRAFYFFIPVTAWLVGPTPMLITGLLVTALLMYLDRHDKTDILMALQERIAAQQAENSGAGQNLQQLIIPLMDVSHPEGQPHAVPPPTRSPRESDTQRPPTSQLSGIPLLGSKLNNGDVV